MRYVGVRRGAGNAADELWAQMPQPQRAQSAVEPFNFSNACGRASLMKPRHSVAAFGLPGRFMMMLSFLIPHTALDMTAAGVIL